MEKCGGRIGSTVDGERRTAEMRGDGQSRMKRLVPAPRIHGCIHDNISLLPYSPQQRGCEANCQTYAVYILLV